VDVGDREYVFWNVTYADTSKELATAIIAVDDSFILMKDLLLLKRGHQSTKLHGVIFTCS
jgi:hypothetical protein